MNDNGTHTDGPKPGSDRNFGLVFGAMFGIISFYPMFHGGAVRLWALGLALIFMCMALLRPAFLAPLNLMWFKFGLLLGKIVTPVVMLVLFIVVVLPLGLLMRLMKSDPLALHFDSSLPSYWIKRSPCGPAAATMRHQF